MVSNSVFKPCLLIQHEQMDINNNLQISKPKKKLFFSQRLEGGRSNIYKSRPKMLESISNGSQRRVSIKCETCPSVNAERYVTSMRSKKMGCLDTVAEVASENSPPPTLTCTTIEDPIFVSTSTLSSDDFYIRTRNMLLDPATLLSSQPSSPSLSELTEGLRTAMARVDRLTEYRRQQTSRNALLQQQVDQMGAELDQSVDALRAQKSKLETERRRTNVETRELRRQLSEAVAVMEQSKISAADGFRKAVLVVQNSDSEKEVFCSNCEKLSLDALTLRASVERLERDLSRQREISEKETSRMRGQLTEATSDARSLRLQLARLSRVSSGTGEANTKPTSLPIGQSGSPCTQCQRLQKLVDVLQWKQHNQPDVVTGCASSSRITPPASFSRRAVEVQTNFISSLKRSPLEFEFVLPNPPPESCEVTVQTDEPPQLGPPMLNDSGFVEPTIQPNHSTPVMSLPSEDCGNLFSLLESFGGDTKSNHVTDLTTEYLEEKLGQRLQITHSEAVQSLIREDVSRKSKQLSPTAHNRHHSSSSSNSLEVERLRERLEILEDEVQSSADQLKESNVEFLQLRERLTNATVERAHLKATVDGLDDQVIQLEAALFERSQQLRHYKKELDKLSKQKQENSSKNCSTVLQMSGFIGANADDCTNDDDSPLLSVSIAPALTLSTLYKSPPRTVQRIRLPSCLDSPRFRLFREKISIGFEKLTPSAIKAHMYINTTARVITEKISVYHEKLGRPCNLIGARLMFLSDKMVGKSPRVYLFIAMLIYLCLLHLLLMSYWIQ